MLSTNILLASLATILNLSCTFSEDQELYVENPYSGFFVSDYVPADMLMNNELDYVDISDYVLPSLMLTDLTRKKRSTSEQSIRSLIMKFYKSSTIFKNSLDKLLSPTSEVNFDAVMQNITTVISEDADKNLVGKLRETVKSTFDKLTPEVLINTFADSLEELMKLNDRFTPDRIKDVLKSLETSLESGEELSTGDDDELGFVKTFGFAVYNVLIEQEMASSEYFRPWINLFTSKLNSLKNSDVSTTTSTLETTTASSLLSTITESSGDGTAITESSLGVTTVTPVDAE